MDREVEIEEITKHLVSVTDKNCVPMPDYLIKGHPDDHVSGFGFMGIVKAWENIVNRGVFKNWEFTFSGYRGAEMRDMTYKEILDAAAYFKKEGVLTTSRISNGKIIYRWEPLKLYK